jgi:restriction endonuclease S subunit
MTKTKGLLDNIMALAEMSWEVKPLGELCEVFTDGDWIESKDQSPEGIRLVQTGNIGEGVFKDREDKARFISKATFARLNCTEVFEGDCLVSRLPDPVGRACILPDTGKQMITGVDCSIIRFKHKVMKPEFFQYYSQSDLYLKDVAKLISGTTRDRISRKNLGTVPVPNPPLPEQERIVGKLDAAFAALAEAQAHVERNRANARELFESYLNGVFEGLANDENCVHALGDEVGFQGGSQPPKSEFIYKPQEGYVRFLQIRDFKRDDKATYIPLSRKNRTCEEQDIHARPLWRLGW